MFIIAIFLQKSVLSFEIAPRRVFLSAPAAPNERNVAYLEKGMGIAACDVYSGRKVCFDKAI